MALFSQSINIINMTNHDPGGKYINNIPSLYHNILINSEHFAGRVDILSTQVDYRFTSHEPETGLYNHIHRTFYNTTHTNLATHLMPLPVPEP